jgi:hypothetical protein
MASLNLRNFRKAGWRVGKQLDVTKLTIERVVTGKKRIYRPSGSVLWKGYIHEELHDQSRSPIAESNLTLNHLTVFRSQERQQEKRHMYAWMLLRLMDEKELREGVNRFWYEEFIPKNRQQLENDARLFDEVRL